MTEKLTIHGIELMEAPGLQCARLPSEAEFNRFLAEASARFPSGFDVEMGETRLEGDAYVTKVVARPRVGRPILPHEIATEDES